MNCVSYKTSRTCQTASSSIRVMDVQEYPRKLKLKLVTCEPMRLFTAGPYPTGTAMAQRQIASPTPGSNVGRQTHCITEILRGPPFGSGGTRCLLSALYLVVELLQCVLLFDCRRQSSLRIASRVSRCNSPRLPRVGSPIDIGNYQACRRDPEISLLCLIPTTIRIALDASSLSARCPSLLSFSLSSPTVTSLSYSCPTSKVRPSYFGTLNIFGGFKYSYQPRHGDPTCREKP
jgi:hypothetical protein